MADDTATAVAEIRELLAAFAAGGDARPLTAAIERTGTVLAAPGFAALDPGVKAVAWTLGAAAATWRARTADARPDDLDLAIAWTEQAIANWPPDDPNRAAALANMGTALTDRYERDGNRNDLDRALAAFDAAIPALGRGGRRVDIALHAQGVAHHARASASGGLEVADLERAIALFHEALESPEPDDDERAGYLNSLGLSLRAKGRALAEPGLMRAADAAYRDARARARRDGDNREAATLNLAAVLVERAESDNDVALLREAIDLYRDVLPGLDGPRLLPATTNLATALVDLYRYSRDRHALDEAIQDLRRSAEALPAGASRLVALANLGAALHEMYAHTGRIAVLDEAIGVQELLLQPPAPRPAERLLNLGVSLLDRYRRRRKSRDLERGIALFAEAAERAGSRIERASALNSQANGLSLRFDATGARGDLETSLVLREEAVAAAPAGSVDVGLYRANLGVDLLRRFELTGDSADLQRAIAEQRRALQDAPAGSAEQPRLLAGLADTLARRTGDAASADDVAEVRATYSRVIHLGLRSLPEQALGAAIRWGEWEMKRRCWKEATEALDRGLAAIAQLLERQQVRADKQSWLADAEGLATAAGFAHVRAGQLHRAVSALEHGRAMLLADALRQHVRLTTREL